MISEPSPVSHETPSVLWSTIIVKPYQDWKGLCESKKKK
jgi:hypothetical protein